MLEGSSFEGPAGEVDKVYAGFFELDAQILAVFWRLAAGLELDAVHFHADDEFGVVDAPLHFIDDLKYDATAVVEISTIFIRAVVAYQRDGV